MGQTQAEGEEGFYDIPCCFRPRTEERGGLTPSHLKTIGDHNLGVVNVCVPWEGGKDVAEIPGVGIIDSHAPKTVLNVKFSGDEGFVWVKVICHGCNYVFEGASQL